MHVVQRERERARERERERERRGGRRTNTHTDARARAHTHTHTNMLHQTPGVNTQPSCRHHADVHAVAGPSCWMLQGVQRVAKFKEHDRNTVKVYMAVMRLPSVDSDIVMHYNYPLFLAPASSSAAVSEVSPRGSTGGSGLGSLARDDNRQAGNGSTAVDLVSVRGEADRLEQESFRPGDTCDTAAGEERFRRILASLKIKDWGLFDAPMPAGS